MAANPTSNFRPVIATDQSADTASPRFSRLEDDRLLQGEGRFLANLRLDGMLHAAIVRSQHAHARLKEVAVGAAAAMPGVGGVCGGPALGAARLRPATC